VIRPLDAPVRTREQAIIDRLAGLLRETYPLLRKHGRDRHDWQRVQERVDAALLDADDYRAARPAVKTP
jgi:hypothetical protein